MKIIVFVVLALMICFGGTELGYAHKHDGGHHRHNHDNHNHHHRNHPHRYHRYYRDYRPYYPWQVPYADNYYGNRFYDSPNSYEFDFNFGD